MLVIRRAVDADASAVADVFLASFRAAYPTLPAVHTDEQVRAWIRDSVVHGSECWVAVDGGEIVAMMALAPGWIDHLYVAPGRLGEGIGRRLLELAKAQARGPLELRTFQMNERARRFYARSGFVEVERTDGAHNDEREPDVRLRWVPELA
jgi:GNAT superfamily N-acetyltransferase